MRFTPFIIFGACTVTATTSEEGSLESDLPNTGPPVLGTSVVLTEEVIVPPVLDSFFDSNLALDSSDVVLEDSRVPVFLWTELPPKELHSVADWEAFYTRMFAFVQSNMIDVKVTDLILRVLNPVFSSGGVSLWANPETSPMYTHLISRLSSDIGLKFYPYVAEGDDRVAWSNYVDGRDAVEGVFALAAHWNNELLRLGSGSRFSGVVFDIVEFEQQYDEDIVPAELLAEALTVYKTEYSIDTVAVDLLNCAASIDQYKPIADRFYVRMFDYTLNADLCVTDQITDLFASANIAALDEIADRSSLLWSVQHDTQHTGGALYKNRAPATAITLGNLPVGQFTDFLRASRAQLGNLRGQGLYQYTMFPEAWEVVALEEGVRNLDLDETARLNSELERVIDHFADEIIDLEDFSSGSDLELEDDATFNPEFRVFAQAADALLNFEDQSNASNLSDADTALSDDFEKQTL